MAGVTEIIGRSIGEVKSGRFRSTQPCPNGATDSVNRPWSRLSKALLLAYDTFTVAKEKNQIERTGLLIANRGLWM